MSQELSSVNRLLQPKGVRVRLLKCCPAGALVYVYRPAMLHKRLERTDIADFLHGQGYASLKLSGAPLRCIASAAWFTWPATIIKDTVLRG